MPKPPPPTVCLYDDEDCECRNCCKLDEWYNDYKATLDDIIFRSNVHTCFDKDDEEDVDSESGKAKKKTGGKNHSTAKGCRMKNGKCSARFPRPVYSESRVDPKDGHIELKKLDGSINDITPTVTYGFRCNTDTTSLQSGTGIKATVGYVCDYLTKTFLKTHQIFSSMYDAWNR
ncbi:hypothetical protein BKA70DRAFT_1110724, partial [Coprinopsis sp. MPI-PUGE-AT-0042]